MTSEPGSAAVSGQDSVVLASFESYRGAEHMVAILTDQPATALHEALKSMATADRAGGLAALLRSTLAETPFQAGVLSIYTAAGG